MEKQINDKIKNYFSLIDNNITKLNNIADELNILKNLKNRNTIHIKTSFVILNKNSNKFDEFRNENDNLIEKFVKGLGNIFIRVCNKFMQ